MCILYHSLFMTRKIFYTLLIIFLLALGVRILYFPNDITFAYDQARDSFWILQLIKGDFKIVGPPTTIPGIHHGVMFFYLAAPFYLMFNGNPAGMALFIRIANALGIFLAYKIGQNIFNQKVGIISAFIYAVSFEQTQFSLFLSPHSFNVITMLIFIWGMSELIFKKNKLGFVIASLGLGLGIQFHFSAFANFVVFIIMLMFFYKKMPKPNKNVLFIILLIVGTGLFIYMIPGIKTGLNDIKLAASLGSQVASGEKFHLWTPLVAVGRYIKHNIYNFQNISYISLSVILFIIFSFSYLFSKQKKSLAFLALWIAPSLITFLIDDPASPRYAAAIGGSVSIVILFSYLLMILFKKAKLLSSLILALVIFSNINLMTNNNYLGTIYAVNSQDKMSLKHEKELVGYTYEAANGAQFSINSIGVPYNINTTWSYLYEWYGKQKYGYLPVWAGQNASGFDGNLIIISARSEGPKLHFTIIEPAAGLSEDLKQSFLNEEGFFTKLDTEIKFGEIILQKRYLIE